MAEPPLQSLIRDIRVKQSLVVVVYLEKKKQSTLAVVVYLEKKITHLKMRTILGKS